MQQIEFTCAGCGTQYRVDASLAGRVAPCRHCGQKVVVPQPPAAREQTDAMEIGFADAEPPAKPAKRATEVPKSYAPMRDDEDDTSDLPDFASGPDRDINAAPAHREIADFAADEGQPNLGDFDVQNDAPAYRAPSRVRKTSLLPQGLAELALPALLIIAGFGWAGIVVVQHLLAMHSPMMGYVLLGLAVGGLLLIVLPLTLRGVESAAKSLEFELSNGIRVQTLGLIAVPTCALTLGWFADRTSGLITYGILGIALMGVLIILMYRTSIARAAMAMLMAAIGYAFGGALAVGAVALLCVILSKAGYALPWQAATEKREIAKAPDAPAPPRVEAPATKPVIVEAPKIEDATAVVEAPVDAPKPSFVWDRPAVDPAPPFGTAKWPTDVHHLIEVKSSVTLATSSPGSPFLAMVDGVALHVYDLRTGKRIGFIKDQVPPLDGGNGLLSPDGSTLVVSFGNSAGNSGGDMMARAAKNRSTNASRIATPNGSGPVFAPTPAAPELAVWSITDGRLARHIPIQRGRSNWRVLGFAKSNAVVLTAVNPQTAGTVAQVWDTKSASLVREIELGGGAMPTGSAALSAGGKYLAVNSGGRLQMFEIESGQRIGDVELSHATGASHAAAAPSAPSAASGTAQAMSFSPDGSRLAVITSGGSALQLMMFDTTTGKSIADAALAGGARAELGSDDLLWVPRGGGMLIGSDWIDCSSGKVVATLPPQSAGAATGRVRTMLTNYHALVEFLPTGAGTGISAGVQRVIYKTVMLPKREIDLALETHQTTNAAIADPTSPASASTNASEKTTAPETPRKTR